MPASRHSKRSQQRETSGVGVAFNSPIKRHDAKKASSHVKPLGYAAKRQNLQALLDELIAKCNPEGSVSSERRDCVSDLLHEEQLVDDDIPQLPAGDSDNNNIPQVLAEDTSVLPKVDPGSPYKARRTIPDNNTNNLYRRWQEVLPSTIDPYLKYLAATIGRACQPMREIVVTCKEEVCIRKTHRILCLFFDHFESLNITSCECQGIVPTLVLNGFFPTSPTSPRMAVSINLLDFYSTLFERSCDAVNALASALSTFYTRRGFILLNTKGESVEDPFRRGLGYAIQWYDNLRVRVDQQVDMASQHADQMIRAFNIAEKSSSSKLPADRTTSECTRILQQRCPACFAGTQFGRPLSQGGDVQVCLDGNFNHRHLKSAGECPSFYDPIYFISKAQVDTVGARINAVRQSPRKRSTIKVPDEAVDQCQSGHTAGDGENAKTNMERFDDSGVMALVCRHDIPLFLANIDSPGEQQKYGIALIEHLFSFLPSNCTVAALYDIGCVLDRSLEIYPILPSSITDRITFAISAMHAYGHQWACQLVYNPRIREGLGLTDGEGVERFWSRLRKLIGVTRSSARSRRIWLIDRQAACIGFDLRQDLGNWIRRRLTKGVDGYAKTSQDALENCGISSEELRQQWKLQQSAQLSLRAHAPARLKKELDTLISLQGDLDSVDNAIQLARLTIQQISPSKNSLDLLAGLQISHDSLKEKVEALYTSLNVQESFPELDGVDLDFVRTLLMARDLKINIRKRAVGSFFEWDKLDQAAGGKDQSIGTKLHQHTRKAIAKRKPALMTAIRKFNKYCEHLGNLHKSEWNIPLPDSLPTKLSALRDASTLMEDVWITRQPGKVPRWLEDTDVREGIRAVLKLDRCLEERRRLGIEADNLCRWFGRELSALEVALKDPANASLQILLEHRRTNLFLLKTSWITPLTSATRFDAHVSTAQSLPQQVLSLAPSTPVITWLAPQMPHRTYEHIDISLEGDSEPSNIRPDTTPVLSTDTKSLDFNNDDTPQNDNIDDPDILIMEDLILLEPDDVIDDDANPNVTLMQDLNHDHDDPDIIIIEDLDHVNAPGGGTSSNDGNPETPEIELIWTVPNTIKYDTGILNDFVPRDLPPHAFSHDQRVVHHYDGHCKSYVGPSEFGILNSGHNLLNDVCINAGAALLQKFFSRIGTKSQKFSERCAIFSTFDLLSVQGKSTVDLIWRLTRRITYWEKDIWILPIHRKKPSPHWVLAIIYLSSHKILLFDSFSSRSPWKHELKDIMRLVESLVLASNQHGHALHLITEIGWIAHPVYTESLQTNGYDCGLWVLACIAAVLRGHQATGLRECDMPRLRDALYKHFLFLPLAAGYGDNIII